uniref:Protein E4 n=1 Tax=Human papillomavirus 29 TaxID=37112 RepID=VE4_HPV29|nr:RecName: Full=Protein E4 [Human papillomavirus 29]
MADNSAHKKYPLLDLYTPPTTPPARPPKPRWGLRRDRNGNDAGLKQSGLGHSSSSSSSTSSSSSNRPRPTPPPRKPVHERVDQWTVTGPGTVTLQVKTPTGTQVILTVHL